MFTAGNQAAIINRARTSASIKKRKLVPRVLSYPDHLEKKEIAEFCLFCYLFLYFFSLHISNLIDQPLA